MTRLRKVLRLSAADCVLLCHAAALHAAIAVLIRVAPLGWTLRHLGTLYPRSGGRIRSPGSVSEKHEHAPRLGARRALLGRAPRPDVEAKIVWAVRTVTALVPAGSTCLTAALTTCYLLRVGGCESTIRFGVVLGSSSDAPLAAHAWLERRDESPSAVRVVVGGETCARYVALEPAGAWLP